QRPGRHPGIRRLRLHERVPGRPLLPRREGARDRRGDLGGAANAHRQGTGTRVGMRGWPIRPAARARYESARVRSEISPPVSFDGEPLAHLGTGVPYAHMSSRRSRRTRARAVVAAAAVLAVSTMAACSSAQSGAAKNSTLTVAAFNPFSGADATFGPEAMAGCQAAATAINAAGGVLTDKVACT